MTGTFAKMRTVVPDMKLSPNVGSDRSWVWNAAADVSEGEPEAQTLAIRFANSESEYMIAGIMVPSTDTLQTPTVSRRLSSRHSRRTRRSSRPSSCNGGEVDSREENMDWMQDSGEFWSSSIAWR